jgi:predicted Rossmann fold flavoprotein
VSEKQKIYDLIVIGGGAAGFFSAVNAAQQRPGIKILIAEKSTKLLSKVKVSGGGRCNVTHNCFEPTPLSQHYPRGQKELKKLFRLFQAKDTVEWFAKLGVKLKTEVDGRMFPTTDDSQTIIDCFLEQARKFGIEIRTSCEVDKLSFDRNQFELAIRNDANLFSKNILIAIGGHNHTEPYNFIRDTGHNVTPTIPSLFTFNDSEKNFKDLMGVAVPDAEVKIAGTKLFERGPVLITHWGLSGPAVIKLSAWAAEYLHRIKYEFTALMNWTGSMSEEETRKALLNQKSERGKQKVITNPLFALPSRLWERLVVLAEIDSSKIWSEASNKDINRLIEFLIRCPFQIKGKTTFKEEFVSCGGVDLKEINLDTMESTKVPGLYFAGEVLHMDGETGGFNFQAAWTTAWIAAQAVTKQKSPH